ncbi:MAG: hypothetical protein WKF84_29165 [Pyrinomonadaceae bacterium]
MPDTRTCGSAIRVRSPVDLTASDERAINYEDHRRNLGVDNFKLYNKGKEI